MVSLLYQQLFVFSFVAAITVVAWSSFIQVESKILEKIGAKSAGCREAFRQRTTPVFFAAVLLFGVSVTSFVTAFILIGYIKPCTPIIQLPIPNPKHEFLHHHILTHFKGSKPLTLCKLISSSPTSSASCPRARKGPSIALQTVR